MRRDSLSPPVFGAIRLQNVDRVLLDPGLECLPPCQHFPTRNRDRRDAREFGVTIEIIGRERFLEPGDVVIGEHPGGVLRPVDAVRPELLAAPGIDHQFDAVPNRLTSRADKQFVERAVSTAERPPAQFDRPESSIDNTVECFRQRFRLVEENRSVRLDAAPIVAAQQSGDRLAARLAHQVPTGRCRSR